MKKLLPIFALCFISLSSFGTLPPVEQNGKSISTLGPMLKTVMPAIVNVYVQGQMPPSRAPSSDSPTAAPAAGPSFQDTGSGVVIDAKNGLVVTNAHVVRYGQIIIVTLGDGRRFRGNVIGVDTPSDIAVIKINPDKLTALPFADSDKIQVGDVVVAIGNPFGVLNQTVTSGVVSAINRNDLGIEGYENFIQTDASINPGNSGGALVDTKGELIGINTAILSQTGGNIGIGFAIPSNMARSVMDQLIKYGKVERGLLGVYVQDLTPDLADALNENGAKGALITQIAPGSPAAKAGLKAKDIVVDINGRAIENGGQLRNTVGLTRVGNAITMKVLRDNKPLTFTVTLVKREEAFAPEVSTLLAGMRLREFDQLDFNGQEIKGVQVLDLDNNSAGALKGLRAGDVILSANNQLVTTVTELAKIAANNQKHLLLEVKHIGGGNVFVVIDNN